jgi:hypothetical protein
MITQKFCFTLTSTNLYKHYSKLSVLTAIVQRGQRKRYNNATTYVAEVGTILSPKHGVISMVHCRPGTDPIPRTSQTEQNRTKEN